ncbi:hypothetical protein ACIBQ1_49675 [Nonomuraea sp. NPDC050153]|uniref:hypothetical protein n=1 Tax=Nonomuraea sp. NPDC050153 TaxID=3364359 RepID=UPI0037BD04A0
MPGGDLTPLRDQEHLVTLGLDRCDRLPDLTPLTRLPRLRTLRLLDTADEIDLSLFTGHPGLDVILRTGQRVANERLLPRTIKIRRL